MSFGQPLTTFHRCGWKSATRICSFALTVTSPVCYPRQAKICFNIKSSLFLVDTFRYQRNHILPSNDCIPTELPVLYARTRWKCNELLNVANSTWVTYIWRFYRREMTVCDRRRESKWRLLAVPFHVNDTKERLFKKFISDLDNMSQFFTIRWSDLTVNTTFIRDWTGKSAASNSCMLLSRLGPLRRHCLFETSGTSPISMQSSGNSFTRFLVGCPEIFGRPENRLRGLDIILASAISISTIRWYRNILLYPEETNHSRETGAHTSSKSSSDTLKHKKCRFETNTSEQLKQTIRPPRLQISLRTADAIK